MIDSIFTLVTMDAVDAVAVMDCYFTLVTIDAVDAVVAVDAKVNGRQPLHPQHRYYTTLDQEQNKTTQSPMSVQQQTIDEKNREYAQSSRSNAGYHQTTDGE